MQLVISNQTRYQIPRKSFTSLFARTMKLLQKVKQEGVIEVSLVNEKEIQLLNKQYRKKDKVTDVLSFGFEENTDPEKELLGQIIICPVQANRQKGKERSLKSELNTLFVHGLLHIFGFDHENDEDFYTMQSFEKRILGSDFQKN